MAPIPGLAEQHADEAAFLAVLRRLMTSAPHWSLVDLARLDERIEAHLDGLRVAGDDGWNACLAGLQRPEPGEVFTAAVLALEAGDPGRLDPVLDAVRAEPAAAAGLAAALAWLTESAAALHLGTLLKSPSPILRAAGLDAAVAHGEDPGVALEQALESDEPALRASAYAAVGRLWRSDLLPAVRHGLDDPDAGCRVRSAWSGALLGDAAAVGALRRLAECDEAAGEEAAAVAVRRMSPADASAWQRELAMTPGAARAAIAAAGAIGDPTLLAWLIEQMSDPALARLAGESFTLITGVDLVAERLTVEAPTDHRAGPSESPEDEDVALDLDEHLPWPDLEGVQAWYSQRGKQLAGASRLLLGRRIEPTALRDVLRHGRQRQRMAAAIELAILSARAPFDVTAPALRQLARLSSA